MVADFHLSGIGVTSKEWRPYTVSTVLWNEGLPTLPWLAWRAGLITLSSFCVKARTKNVNSYPISSELNTIQIKVMDGVQLINLFGVLSPRYFGRGAKCWWIEQCSLLRQAERDRFLPWTVNRPFSCFPAYNGFLHGEKLAKRQIPGNKMFRRRSPPKGWELQPDYALADQGQLVQFLQQRGVLSADNC